MEISLAGCSKERITSREKRKNKAMPISSGNRLRSCDSCVRAIALPGRQTIIKHGRYSACGPRFLSVLNGLKPPHDCKQSDTFFGLETSRLSRERCASDEV